MTKADIILAVQDRVSNELRGIAAGLRASAQEAGKTTRELDRLRDSQIQVARSAKDYTTALQLIDSELARTKEGTARYNTLLAQSATVAQQAGRANAQSARETTAATAQTARQATQLADSEIRAARAAGDHSRALSLVSQQLAQAAQGSVRYNTLLAQQATISRQAKGPAPTPPPAPGGGLGVGSAVSQIGGAVGVGLGAKELFDQGVAAGRAALELQRTERVTAALTGTQGRYNEVVALARDNQALYGGSLKENIEQLSGFAVAARRSGVAVATLNDLSKRLAILSPEQGASGASVAINEALSGNVSSLVRRFELPKELLKGIEDSSTTTAEKLAILDRALAQSGVSAAALKAAVDPTAEAYNRLGAAADRAQTGLGASLAKISERPARGLAVVLGAVADSFNQAEAAAGTGRNIALASDSYATYTQRVTEANAQIPFYIKNIDLLTAAQFAEIRANEAAAQAADRANIARQQANEINFAGVTAYEQAAIAQSGATQATNLQTQALGDQARSSLEAAAQSEQLRAVQAALAGIGEQVASGLLSAGDAALILSQKYGIASDAAAQLVALQAQVAQTKLNAQALGDQRAGERDSGRTQAEINAQKAGNGSRAGTGRTAADITADANAARIQAERQRALAAAQRDYAVSTGSSADRLAILRRELAGLRRDTPEYYKKLTEISQAEKQLAAERDRNGRKGATEARKEAKSAEDIRKARFDLLSNEEKLADLRARVASGKLGEADRLEAVKQIRDLEEKISEEREKQVKSAIDARLAALDDRKQRRVEERELNAARRILASGDTSGEQKAAAQDAIARIELERQKRQIEIADKTRQAGGVAAPTAPTAPGAGAPSAPGTTAALPGADRGALPGTVAPLPTGAPGTDSVAQLLDALSRVQFQAFIDGRPVAGQLIATLAQGLQGAQAAGVGKR